jgi:hypothetical protein
LIDGAQRAHAGRQVVVYSETMNIAPIVHIDPSHPTSTFCAHPRCSMKAAARSRIS